MDWTDHQSDSVGHFIYFSVRFIPISNKMEEGLVFGRNITTGKSWI